MGEGRAHGTSDDVAQQGAARRVERDDDVVGGRGDAHGERQVADRVGEVGGHRSGAQPWVTPLSGRSPSGGRSFGTVKAISCAVVGEVERHVLGEVVDHREAPAAVSGVFRRWTPPAEVLHDHPDAGVAAAPHRVDELARLGLAVGVLDGVRGRLAQQQLQVRRRILGQRRLRAPRRDGAAHGREPPGVGRQPLFERCRHDAGEEQRALAAVPRPVAGVLGQRLRERDRGETVARHERGDHRILVPVGREAGTRLAAGAEHHRRSRSQRLLGLGGGRTARDARAAPPALRPGSGRRPARRPAAERARPRSSAGRRPGRG